MVVSNTAETCGFKGFLENNNGTAGIFLFISPEGLCLSEKPAVYAGSMPHRMVEKGRKQTAFIRI